MLLKILSGKLAIIALFLGITLSSFTKSCTIGELVWFSPCDNYMFVLYATEGAAINYFSATGGTIPVAYGYDPAREVTDAPFATLLYSPSHTVVIYAELKLMGDIPALEPDVCLYSE